MTALVDPAVFLWVLLFLLGMVFLLKRPRSAGVVLILLCVGWWMFEVTGAPRRLLASLEEPYRGTAQRDGRAMDAIVVLGGGARASTNDFAGLDFNLAADRILTAMDLVRRGQGKVLVLGGSATVQPAIAPEAALYRRWLESWKFDTVPILDLGVCRNTRDEAVRAAELAEEHDWSRLLLVTSASHMRRSEAAFRKVGLDVTPVGCDFMGTALLDRRRSWVPQAQSMVLLQIWLREVVGYRYYRFRGWV